MDPLAELRRPYAVSRERFAVFRQFLPRAEGFSACLTGR
jgi:hypothetical protein